MKNIAIVCLLLALVTGCRTQAQHAAGSGATAPTSNRQWLEMTHSQLAGLKSVRNLTNVGLNSGAKDSDGTYHYSPKGDGLIMFEDKSWVLLATHSIHDEDGLDDLALIRTSEDKYYLNRGHKCGSLSLRSKERIVSLATFLETGGIGPKGPRTEPTPWEPYEANLLLL